MIPPLLTPRASGARLTRRQWLALAAGAAFGAGPGRARAQERPSRLRLIGETRIPQGLRFQGTVVGGLSGIDHDPASGLYYLLSDDDASERGDPRFYTARIALDARSVGPVSLESVVTLRRPDGASFGRGEVDPESIRWRADTSSLLWSSEGQVRAGVPPFIREMRPDGMHMREFQLPPMFSIDAQGRRGPRHNLGPEGLALTPDGRGLWMAMENALLEDGPMPSLSSGGGACRLTLFDLDSGRAVRQIAYGLDPIPRPPRDPGGAADNGISEILMRDARHLWVLERSWAAGVGNSLRIHEVDLELAASLTAGLDALPAPPLPAPVAKRLVLDFASLGLSQLDNTEGLCFGPMLEGPPGQAPRPTLLALSDDNFNRQQITQILAFEILP